MPDLFGQSDGAQAVLSWSARIHGHRSDRHKWAMDLVFALDQGQRDNLPDFPSGWESTQDSRMATALRIYDEVNGTVVP